LLTCVLLILNDFRGFYSFSFRSLLIRIHLVDYISSSLFVCNVQFIRIKFAFILLLPNGDALLFLSGH